jgi:hypothetical protein
MTVNASEIFRQVHNDIAIAAAITAPADRETTAADCTEAEYHGNPFKYCGCGWTYDGGDVMTQAEKIDYIFETIKELKGLEKTVLPLLESMEKNPMLKMFFKR